MTNTMTPVRRRPHGFSYEAALRASSKVNWKVEDLIGGDKKFDYQRPFMPEGLARTSQLPFLDAREKLLLNHIRAHGYLYTFGLVEEFILPFLMDHARPLLSGDDQRIRALLQFAGEEAKHIDLFKRFRAEFQRSFQSECPLIGPPDAVAKEVLSKP